MYRTIGRIEKGGRLVAAVVAASAAGAGSEPAGVSAATSWLRVTAAVTAGAPGVELVVARVESGVGAPLTEVGGKAAPAAAATAAASEDRRMVAARVAGRAAGRSVAAGGRAGLGAFPLAFRRLRRMERLLEATG
jgi:hypothetical protein